MPALSLLGLYRTRVVHEQNHSAQTQRSQNDYAPGFYTNAALTDPTRVISFAKPTLRKSGLFTLVPSPSYGGGTAEEGEEPASATHVTRARSTERNATQATDVGREIKAQDHEPEVYANAALRVS
jgi:hypothetical protein